MHMAAEQNCAFVTFSAREAAEAVRRGGDRRRGEWVVWEGKPTCASVWLL